MSSPAKNFPFNKGKLKVLHLGKKTPMHHFPPYSRESCWKAALQEKTKTKKKKTTARVITVFPILYKNAFKVEYVEIQN